MLPSQSSSPRGLSIDPAEKLVDKRKRMSFFEGLKFRLTKSPNASKSRNSTKLKEIGPNRIFGVEIEDLCLSEKTICPKIVTFLTEQIISMGGENENGIFRISAEKCRVDELVSILDRSEPFDLSRFSVHTFAACLKQYLRSLPTPLLPYDLYDEFLKLCTLQRAEILPRIRSLLSKLSKIRLGTLCKLLIFLKTIAMKSNDNLMTTSNLSIVFGVNCLRPKGEYSEDPSTLFTDSQKVSKSFELLLIHFEKCRALFEDPKF
jgi:hypothetical protein